jgi:hypothetical protein
MAKLLTSEERNYIYNQLMIKLLDLDLYDSDLESIKKLKIMAKLYKDNGMEFRGELELPQNKVITYEFYKDHRRQTNVNISRNINKSMTLGERTEYYNKIMDCLKKYKLLNSNVRGSTVDGSNHNKNILSLIKKASAYKDNGTEFSGELLLPDTKNPLIMSGKKLIFELYNDYKHESIVKILGDDDLMTKEERAKIYKEIVTGLKKLDIWDSDLESISIIKKMALDYKENGTEAVGELPLPSHQKFVYQFSKDHSKQTFVKISREHHQIYNDESSSDEDVPELIQVEQ